MNSMRRELQLVLEQARQLPAEELPHLIGDWVSLHLWMYASFRNVQLRPCGQDRPKEKTL